MNHNDLATKADLQSLREFIRQENQERIRRFKMSESEHATIADIVADIIENMREADKANVVNTPEADLIQFHHGWGTGIRNHYNLWQNPTLVKATGKEHPDDASMVIIKQVWQTLRDTEG